MLHKNYAKKTIVLTPLTPEFANDVIKLVKNVVNSLFACRFFSIFAMKNKTQVWKMWRISQKKYQKCVNLHIFRTLTMEVLKNV